MDVTVASSMRHSMRTLRETAQHGLHWVEARPRAAFGLLWGAWLATRLVALAHLLIGHYYTDPWFYHYAGQFAAGQWPYRDIPVEYPPLALVLILLPALPLLPFAGVAPRPDAAFHLPIVHLPAPNPVRYGAYGTSFAIEMLVIDALTLWLVVRVARTYLPADRFGLRAGMLYVIGVAASGALLQKFDLAIGALCLLAVYAVVSKRPVLGWSALAVATLTKGFPVLAIPALLAYSLRGASLENRRSLRRAATEMAQGLVVFGVVVGGATLIVVGAAGWDKVAHTVFVHASRGAEIESLYANVMLGVGWLPGLGVSTTFHADDLSRVVLSPLGAYVEPLSFLLLAAATLVICLPLVWTLFLFCVRRQVTMEKELSVAWFQFVAWGVAGVALAFLLTFRALPAHYLLVVIPLVAVIRLPTIRLQGLWLGSVAVVALLGQVVTVIWPALVALRPWAVALLTLRNAAWIMAFVALALALWRLVIAYSGSERTLRWLQL